MPATSWTRPASAARPGACHSAACRASRTRPVRRRGCCTRRRRWVRILVVGGPNHGKSRLVNALINAPACAVGDDVTTTAPTVVEYADQPATVRVAGPSPSDAAQVVVGVPRELLRSGLVLVDTPP